MALIKVKGYEFNEIIVKDSFDRRALKFKNNILISLRRIGLTEDDVEVKLEKVAIKKAPACAEWYFDGHRLYYSYNKASNYVQNLFIVSKVIESALNAIAKDKITVEEFISQFTEEKDVEEERKKARELLGVDEDSMDMDEIHKNYKKLAREHHPDMENGSLEKFKEINKAHKLLKRELH